MCTVFFRYILYIVYNILSMNNVPFMLKYFEITRMWPVWVIIQQTTACPVMRMSHSGQMPAYVSKSSKKWAIIWEHDLLGNAPLDIWGEIIWKQEFVAKKVGRKCLLKILVEKKLLTESMQDMLPRINQQVVGNREGIQQNLIFPLIKEVKKQFVWSSPPQKMVFLQR